MTVSPAARRRAPAAIALLGVLLAACGPSKTVQCDRLMTAAQTATDTARNAATGAPEALLAAADGFDRAAAELDALDLRDGELKAMQTQLVGLYNSTSQSTREFLTAVDQKDRGLAEIALQALEQSAAQESAALQELNAYCQPPAASTPENPEPADPQPADPQPADPQPGAPAPDLPSTEVPAGERSLAPPALAQN